jgi:glutamate 5-kinase
MVRGTLTLDAGAAQVIRQSGRSLLAVGVTHVMGKFRRGDMVICLDLEGREVGRGLTNYDANETARIKGRSSHDIERILGYVYEPELIHRDNLVLT